MQKVKLNTKLINAVYCVGKTTENEYVKLGNAGCFHGIILFSIQFSIYFSIFGLFPS